MSSATWLARLLVQTLHQKCTICRGPRTWSIEARCSLRQDGPPQCPDLRVNRCWASCSATAIPSQTLCPQPGHRTSRLMHPERCTKATTPPAWVITSVMQPAIRPHCNIQLACTPERGIPANQTCTTGAAHILLGTLPPLHLMPASSYYANASLRKTIPHVEEDDRFIGCLDWVGRALG